MRSLLIFILRFHAFFLFLILSAACVFMIYREKSYQRATLINGANTVVGAVQGARDDIGDYFHLRQTNRRLLSENALLRSKLSDAWFVDSARFHTVHDSIPDSTALHRQQLYRYIAATVINNSVYRFDNYLTLRVGLKHGITAGMGVVGPDGVVGIVRDVGINTCRAFSMLHHRTFIPAKLQSSGDQGRVIWKGTDPQFAYMIDIGQHVIVKKGDAVVTSGFSAAFPTDVMIGRVESSTTTQGSGFLEIKIRLTTDFNRLENVYVVQNLLSRELLTLEGHSP